jgi:hypothetical protein
MAMFRKLILSGVLGIATLTGLTMTPSTADARPPVRARYERHHSFEVKYLECGHWQCYGTYCSRDLAGRAAEQLRCRGFAVRIEGC